MTSWQRLPEAIRSSIEKHAARAVRLQRQDQERANADARTALAGRRLSFNEVEAAPFRAKLAGVYADWRKILGARCWSLLEGEVGRLG